MVGPFFKIFRTGAQNRARKITVVGCCQGLDILDFLADYPACWDEPGVKINDQTSCRSSRRASARLP